MKKKKIIKYIKLFLKFLLPAIAGWLEGDSHAIADAIAGALNIFI